MGVSIPALASAVMEEINEEASKWIWREVHLTHP
jgi:hypothetical protein